VRRRGVAAMTHCTNYILLQLARHRQSQLLACVPPIDAGTSLLVRRRICVCAAVCVDVVIIGCPPGVCVYAARPQRRLNYGCALQRAPLPTHCRVCVTARPRTWRHMRLLVGTHVAAQQRRRYLTPRYGRHQTSRDAHLANNAKAPCVNPQFAAKKLVLVCSSGACIRFLRHHCGFDVQVHHHKLFTA